MDEFEKPPFQCIFHFFFHLSLQILQVKIAMHAFSFYFRTAMASDSSQMSAIMWTPPSPDAGKDEVEEELCVAVDAVDRRAIPFFTHDSGAIFIKGGTVVNDDKMEVADVVVEDGKIAQVGQDLEVPSGAKIIDATDKFVMPGKDFFIIFFEKQYIFLAKHL